MSQDNSPAGPFALKDSSLVAIATGRKAQNLRELRDHLLNIQPGSVYYHFWGGLLRPRFDDPQFNNDFAIWAHYALHDDGLAEQLAVIDPTDFPDLEALRREVVEVIEQRLDELERPTWVPADRQFHFIRSQIVVFDTGIVLKTPRELAAVIPGMSLGSVFYHFIDARRRSFHGEDDFRIWLEGLGPDYEDLCVGLAALDPYFATLAELRSELSRIFRGHFQEDFQ